MDRIANWPLPLDIPLPLPADSVVLQALLVLLFLWHILFVYLMVGGTLLTVGFEILGRRRPGFDKLAKDIAGTVTVNKSLAVVLGVGPLLAINVYYTVHFYTANALTGHAWIGLVPLITLTFLLTYLHKYTWTSLAHRKGLHLAIGLSSAALFLFIPLVFLSNINLMLFPDRWADVHGFWSALMLPNVWARYLYFLASAVVVSSLFLLFYYLRAGSNVEERFEGFDRPRLKRLFYTIALVAGALQLGVGSLLFFTLPEVGQSTALMVTVGLAVVFGVLALGLIWGEITSRRASVMPRMALVFTCVTVAAFAMGYGRHLYRDEALREHRRQIAVRTHDIGWQTAAAQYRQATGQTLVRVPLGQRIFEGTCAACHALDRVLVGPSLTEIAELYRENPSGIVTWTEAPFRKREGFTAMPAFKLGEEKLLAVAGYMIGLGSGNPPENAPVDESSEEG